MRGMCYFYTGIPSRWALSAVSLRIIQKKENQIAKKKLLRNPLTADDVKVYIDSQVKAAYDKMMSTPRTEVAEIQGWWNLLAVGPIQPIRVDGPFAPHQVIKVGEPAFVATLIVLNPFLIRPGGISAADALSDFALPTRSVIR